MIGVSGPFRFFPWQIQWDAGGLKLLCQSSSAMLSQAQLPCFPPFYYYKSDNANHRRREEQVPQGSVLVNYFELSPYCRVTPDSPQFCFRAFQIIPPWQSQWAAGGLNSSSACSFLLLLTLHGIVAVPFRLFSWQIQWASGGLVLQLLLNLPLIASLEHDPDSSRYRCRVSYLGLSCSLTSQIELCITVLLPGILVPLGKVGGLQVDLDSSNSSSACPFLLG